MFVLSTRNVCVVYTQCLYCVQAMFVLYRCNVCVVYTQCLCCVHAMFVLCTRNVCVVCMQCFCCVHAMFMMDLIFARLVAFPLLLPKITDLLKLIVETVSVIF